MKYCLLVLSALALFASCKKVDTPQSIQEQMRVGTWYIDTSSKTYAILPGQYETIPYYIQGEDCKKDDYFIFRDNNDGAINTAKEKCVEGQTDEIAIKWGVTDANTKMYIYNAGSLLNGDDDVNAELLNFNGSSFAIRFKQYVTSAQPAPSVDTTTFWVHFKHR